jgi:uncharacterized protein (DUF1810 family)
MATNPEASDAFDLDRFVSAQVGSYEQALRELRAGRKRTHWMWFVFPQIEGLGYSATARRYAIRNREEARAYLGHPVLGPRLVECCSALLAHRARSAREILGSPDDMKLNACATLFETVADGEPVFGRILDAFYGGARDAATLQRLQGGPIQCPESGIR